MLCASSRHSAGWGGEPIPPLARGRYFSCQCLAVAFPLLALAPTMALAHLDTAHLAHAMVHDTGVLLPRI